MAVLKLIMNRLGFVEDIRPYAKLKKMQPKQFAPGRRFVIAFIRKEEPKAMSFKELVESGEMTTMSWKDMIEGSKK
jgi:hypothetical protein